MNKRGELLQDWILGTVVKRTKNDCHLYAHVVFKTCYLVISSFSFVEYGKKCTEMCSARAAGLFFLPQPMIFLLWVVGVAVAVVVAKTPHCMSGHVRA